MGGDKIKKFPQLKVNGLGWEVTKEICDFDQARFFPYERDLVIVVEGEVIRSYEDLVELASRAPHKHKELLEVVILPTIVGG